MAAQNKHETIYGVLDEIQDKSAKGILKWFHAEYVKKDSLYQQDDENEQSELKRLFDDLIGLINNPNTAAKHKAVIKNLSLNQFAQLTIHGHPDDEIRIQDPDENQELNVTVPKVDDKKGESPEQQAERERLEILKRQYDQRRQRDEFFAILLGDHVRAGIDKLKLEMTLTPQARARQNDKGQDVGRMDKMRLNKAVDDVSGFQAYTEKLRKDTKNSIEPDKSELRYVFKAEAMIYNLMLNPSNEQAKEDCEQYAKKMSGALNVKYIVLGIVILAAALAIIGVTCGIAAGVIVIPGLVLGTMMGVSMLTGGFTIGLGLGYSSIKGSSLVEKFSKGKISKGGIYNGSPWLNRNLSHHLTRATKAIKKPSSAMENNLDKAKKRHDNFEKFRKRDVAHKPKHRDVEDGAAPRRKVLG